MPLGSVFNVTSFSARILSQAMYNPKVRCLSRAGAAGTLL